MHKVFILTLYACRFKTLEAFVLCMPFSFFLFYFIFFSSRRSFLSALSPPRTLANNLLGKTLRVTLRDGAK